MNRKAVSTFLMIHVSAFIVMAILLAATALIESIFLTRRLLLGTGRPLPATRPRPGDGPVHAPFAQIRALGGFSGGELLR